MAGRRLTSPMTAQQILDEYFIENRTRLLDLAAFLDRLDRAGGGGDDFRAAAFAEALAALRLPTPSRTKQMQMIFSDPTLRPLESLDRKSARGAYDRGRQDKTRDGQEVP